MRLRSAGFTLLEIMIALVVLAIGVLGLALLQLTSMQANQNSYNRSQAIVLAYEMSDRMRANRVVAGQDLYNLDPAALPGAGPNCTAGPCSNADMAASDLGAWLAMVQGTLPGGTARIDCLNAPCTQDSMQLITVMWDDQRTGAADTSCPAAGAYNPQVHLACFTVGMQP